MSEYKVATVGVDDVESGRRARTTGGETIRILCGHG
jgi:hypothetical protein